jgi:prolyl-tRNA synthetase
VPLRVEIGPKDIEKAAVLVARRDTREKQSLAMDGLPNRILQLLDDVQQSLFQRAFQFREEHTMRVDNYDAFKAAMDGRPGFVIAPWCGSADCETRIKNDTQATIRNMPLNAAVAVAASAPAGRCVRCDNPAAAEAWFAKAY